MIGKTNKNIQNPNFWSIEGQLDINRNWFRSVEVQLRVGRESWKSRKNSYEKVRSIESARHNRRKVQLIKKSIGKLEILANKSDQSKSDWRATENYRNDVTGVQNPLKWSRCNKL